MKMSDARRESTGKVVGRGEARLRNLVVSWRKTPNKFQKFTKSLISVKKFKISNKISDASIFC